MPPALAIIWAKNDDGVCATLYDALELVGLNGLSGLGGTCLVEACLKGDEESWRRGDIDIVRRGEYSCDTSCDSCGLGFGRGVRGLRGAEACKIELNAEERKQDMRNMTNSYLDNI